MKYFLLPEKMFCIVADQLKFHTICSNWHQFSDQATSGRFDGENFQVGFTDVCDTPYSETVAALRHIGAEMYRIRSEK